jgi:hypothetical protein
MNWIKYLPMIFRLKQVSDKYKAETGAVKKPFYLKRRFWGVVVCLVAELLRRKGVDIGIDQEILTNNIMQVIQGVLYLYGVIMVVVGQLGREKK